MLAQSKRAALLAFLVLARPHGFVRRDALLALFWPEMDLPAGRRALSQALTFLRRHLGREVLVTRGPDEVGINPQAVRDDVGAFHRAMADRDWHSAIALYEGDLLEGLHVAGAGPFLDWVDRERERLRESACDAAWQHATALLDGGHAVEAERVAQRALTLVPTDESAVRAFIEALARCDRAAALRFYEKFAALLAKELDVAPSPATVAVARDLRQRHPISTPAGVTVHEGDDPTDDPRLPPRSPAVSIRAYELYIQGLFRTNEYNVPDMEAAIAALEAAVIEAPFFAPARAALANAYNEKADMAGPRRDLREKAYVNAQAALALDPDLAEAHVARGNVLWNQENRFPHVAALREFKRAAELRPSWSAPHERLATVFCHIGLLDLALEEARAAVALDPMDYWARFRVGLALWSQQRYAETVEELGNLPPQVVPMWRGPMLAEAMLYLGEPQEALRLLNGLRESYPTDPWIRATRALVLASLGDRAQAVAEISEAMAHLYLPTHAHHSEFTIGCTYAVLGNVDEAIHWLRRAADDGWPCYPRYAADPTLTHLQGDPRFVALLNDLKVLERSFRDEFGPVRTADAHLGGAEPILS